MRLLCFTTSDAPPKIVPAPQERTWMDQSPNKFAYRCLPLNIANAHGWMVLNTVPVVAEWDGGMAIDAVRVRPLSDGTPVIAASHFGSGVLTFQIHGLFRTEPGYDMMVTGPLNMPKDAIQPLSGVVETDWSPASFTMNWKFTRAHTPVTFDRDEPICMLWPVKRGLIESVEPEICSFESDLELHEAYRTWANDRATFIHDLSVPDSEARARQWQKEYFRGETPLVAAPRDHRVKLRPKPFAGALRWREGGLMDQLNHEQTEANAAGRQNIIEGVLTPGPNTVVISAEDQIEADSVDFIFEPDFLTEADRELLADATRAMTRVASDDADTLDDQTALLRDIARERPEAAAIIRDLQQRIMERLGSFYELTVPLFTDAAHLMLMPDGTWADPHAIRAHPDGSEHITAYRDFASVVFLNDDYEGGELYFPRLDLVVKPRAGMLLAFTAGWHHEHAVAEILTGAQLTMPAFHTFSRSRRDLDLDIQTEQN